jgi:hypothetical protein
MSKVVASLVRILREPIHTDLGYVTKCLVGSYLFDYEQYLISHLSVFLDSLSYVY